MGLLQKLFRRVDDEKWVAENPGKRDFKIPPASQTEMEEAARTRVRMEQEMKDDGRRMDDVNKRSVAENAAAKTAE